MKLPPVARTLIVAAIALALPATVALAADPPGSAAQNVSAEAQHTGEAQKSTLFAGTIAQTIAALIVFGVTFAVLRAKAWGPILKGLSDREAKIKADLQDAEAARRAAEQRLAEYNRQLSDAESRVREMLASAQRDAEATGTRLRMQAQQEAEEAKQRATKEIEESRAAAVAEIRTYAADLSTGIAAKILRRELNDGDQAELIRSSLEELQTAGRNN